MKTRYKEICDCGELRIVCLDNTHYFVEYKANEAICKIPDNFKKDKKSLKELMILFDTVYKAGLEEGQERGEEDGRNEMKDKLVEARKTLLGM